MSGTSLPAHGFESSIQNLPDETPAATVEGTVYTLGTLRQLLAMRTAPYRRAEAFEFTAADLVQTAREIPVYQQLAASEAITLDSIDHALVHTQLMDQLQRVIYREEVISKIPASSTEALRRLYQRELQTHFITPTRYIYTEFVYPQDRSTTPSLEVDVPSHIRRNLLATEDDPTLSPILLSTLRELASGQPSPSTIRVENEWRIVELQAVIPSSIISFEAAISTVADMHRGRELSLQRTAFFARLASESPSFTIHPENLIGEGDLAMDDDLLITIANREFTRLELLSAAGLALSKDVPLSSKKLRALALETGIVQDALLNEMIEQKGLQQRPDIVEYERLLRETLLARKAIIAQLDTSTFEPSHEEVRLTYRRRQLARNGSHDSILHDWVEIPNAMATSSMVEELLAVGSRSTFRARARELVETTASAITITEGQRTKIEALPRELYDTLLDGRIIGTVKEEAAETIGIHWLESTTIQLEPTSEAWEKIADQLRTERLQSAIEAYIKPGAAKTKIEVHLDGLPTENPE